MTSEDLQVKAEQLIAARAAQFTSEYRFTPSTPFPVDVSDLYRSSGFLSARQIDIVSHDATSLAEAIAKRTYTAVEVTEAFCRSAALAQEATNCLAWFAPKEALDAAKRLDEVMEKTGRPVGPLHGVPISVKGGSSVWYSSGLLLLRSVKAVLIWALSAPADDLRLHQREGLPPKRGTYRQCRTRPRSGRSYRRHPQACRCRSVVIHPQS